MTTIVYPAIALAPAGWLKVGNSIDSLFDASPTDDLGEWQGLRIFDAAGSCYQARRVFRKWPASRLGLLICRIANESIHVGMELEEVQPPALSELVSQVAAAEPLPKDTAWESQRHLIEYVCS